MRHITPLVAPALAFTAFVTGCRKEEVTSYRVPKEPAAAATPHDHAAHAKADAPPPAPAAPAPASSGGTMASTPVATASGAGLTWKGPAHWTDKGASGMRKGTFTINGENGAAAELAITAFPGDVGGEAANVNRWRGQLQLAPLSEAEVVRSIERIEFAGLKVGLVDLRNDVNGVTTRMLGAFVAHQGATWFFKLTGPDALVAKEKGAFLDFVKTIRPAGQ